MSLETLRFEWDCGQAEVQTLGAMLGPVIFTIADGRKVAPFVVAPWHADRSAEHEALPGILKSLRGEWPCVPFGAPKAPEGLPAAWMPPKPTAVDPFFHGAPANDVWTVADLDHTSVMLRYVYPDDHPLERLERRIEGVLGSPMLRCSLSIVARREVATTLALHPVFRLAQSTGRTDLDIPFASAHTFPMAVEPGVSQLVPDAQFTDLRAAPTSDGFWDLTRLPLAQETEELVQLLGVRGQATLSNLEEGYRATLRFDPEIFPSILLWMSNRGRTAYPWNGRFTALGIEPVCGAFDLGPDVGAWAGNPIAQSGIPTARTLQAGEVFSTDYTLSVESL